MGPAGPAGSPDTSADILAKLAAANAPLRIGNRILNAYRTNVPIGSSYSTVPLHLETAWVCGVTLNVMYNIAFDGYLFLSAKPIKAQAVGYLYGANGHTSNSVVHFTNAVAVSTYCATNGHLVFKLVPSTDWHASDLVLELIGGGSSYQTGAANSFTIVSATHSVTNL